MALCSWLDLCNDLDLAPRLTFYRRLSVRTHSKAMAGVSCSLARQQQGEGSHLQDVWQLLELAAIHHPDALAVVDAAAESRQLTYQQLYDRAASLASFLRRQGVRRGDRVGVLSRNCSYILELHFAAAAIHAVVVNLNIHLAPRELSYILKDSAPVLVFADRHSAASLLAAAGTYHEAVAEQGAQQACSTVVWLDVEGSSQQQQHQQHAAEESETALPPGLQARLPALRGTS